MTVEEMRREIRCAECSAFWLSDAEGPWRCYLISGDELLFYCPECAEREFGDASAWRAVVAGYRR
jgi:Zn finger protein HypA/HybF involved in hydrogenase expression